jgi:hypothetical protein
MKGELDVRLELLPDKWPVDQAFQGSFVVVKQRVVDPPEGEIGVTDIGCDREDGADQPFAHGLTPFRDRPE